MVPEFYTKAQKYWASVPPTMSGMMGGMSYLSPIDIRKSKRFLGDLDRLGNQTALDCGAGIGRVSKMLLMPGFQSVDLVEQNPEFAQKASKFCTSYNLKSSRLENPNHLGTIYVMGLQNFTPLDAKYDLIWCQWVLGHLTDNDLIQFFRRLRGGLKKHGYLVIKENVTFANKVEEDDVDSSVMRPLKLYKYYLKQAGYLIKKIMQQDGFPRDIYPVYMIACQPDPKVINSEIIGTEEAK